MATINQSIALQDKMSAVFSKIQKVAQGVTGTFKNVNDRVDEMQEKMNKTKNNASGLLSSLVKFGAIQKIFGLVSSQVGSAIERMDTLNNYPKVMSNLGISTEQSQASINRLSEGLKGLPTTLQAGASAVQRLTSANKNIGASTEMFLAMNNAILAGGASSERQSQALEQLSQAYAKGKPDMVEWKTLNEVMPAQLDQVAKAMGKASASDLGESLRSGTTSMNEFMNTLMKLNEEGIDGLPSLAEQAKNATGGFNTAIANMKSAVTRGITSIIDSINKGLANIGLPDLQTMIANFSNFMEQSLTKVGQVIQNILYILEPLINNIRNLYNYIATNWTQLEPIIMSVVYALLALAVAIQAIKFIQFIANPATIVMLVIVALIAVLIYFWNTNDEVANAILFIWDALQLGAMALWLGLQTVFYSIVLAAQYMYLGMQGVLLGAMTAWYGFLNGVEAVASGVVSIIQGMVNAVKNLINKLIDILNKIPRSKHRLCRSINIWR